MGKAETYIKNFKHRGNNSYYGGYAEWISPANALEAVKIAREECIKKAKDYILHNTHYDYHRECLSFTKTESLANILYSLEKELSK